MSNRFWSGQPHALHSTLYVVTGECGAHNRWQCRVCLHEGVTALTAEHYVYKTAKRADVAAAFGRAYEPARDVLGLLVGITMTVIVGVTFLLASCDLLVQ